MIRKCLKMQINVGLFEMKMQLIEIRILEIYTK
jgi:hypothetical protein